MYIITKLWHSIGILIIPRNKIKRKLLAIFSNFITISITVQSLHVTIQHIFLNNPSLVDLYLHHSWVAKVYRIFALRTLSIWLPGISNLNPKNSISPRSSFLYTDRKLTFYSPFDTIFVSTIYRQWLTQIQFIFCIKFNLNRYFSTSRHFSTNVELFNGNRQFSTNIDIV